MCNGTDDALLKGGVDNEKTFLLSHWFHCVKLPVDVMEEDHPFHNVFAVEPMEHLFVCSVTGDNHDPLESDTGRVELWESMQSVLASEYKSKPDKSLKEITRLLDQMDVADERRLELVESREAILEKEGPKSRKLKKVDKDLAKAEKACKELQKKVAKASHLKLRRTKEDLQKARLEAERAKLDAKKKKSVGV